MPLPKLEGKSLIFRGDANYLSSIKSRIEPPYIKTALQQDSRSVKIYYPKVISLLFEERTPTKVEHYQVWKKACWELDTLWLVAFCNALENIIRYLRGFSSLDFILDLNLFTMISNFTYLVTLKP